MSFINAPSGSLLRSVYEPCCATFPSGERTMMLSERLMVERRWAMEMVVLLPFRRAARAALTRVSDSASRADVARGEMVLTWWRDGAREAVVEGGMQ